MSILEFLPALVGYILCILTIIHAFKDAQKNRVQRLLMLLTLFFFGTFLEFFGVATGNYFYAKEYFMLFGIVPLSVTLAWVAIIYSVMIIGERLNLSIWHRVLVTTLIALSLDWGMDPIAVEIGAWTWIFKGGDYFGIPGFNFIGWFFISISYLIPYCLSWNKESKRPQLLTIKDIDNDDSWIRKLYTIFVVVPIGAGILIIVGLITRNPIIYDTPLIILVIWAIFTVFFATGTILWKRETLKRVKWFDLIPPIVLVYIGLNYALFGFIIGRSDLGFLMLLFGLPFWLALIFTLRKRRK